jgi:hypothetical protein
MFVGSEWAMSGGEARWAAMALGRVEDSEVLLAVALMVGGGGGGGTSWSITRGLFGFSESYSSRDIN